MTLTDDQRQLVTLSFSRLVPISNEAVSLFYQRLWEIAPETKPLFHATDMSEQGMKLMETLGIVVRALYDFESITPFLQDLGKRHLRYGVTKAQFDLVKAALLWMLRECLQEDFTPDTREAWDAAYDLIATIALSAYE